MMLVKYFKWPLAFTIAGLILGGWIGWLYTGTFAGILSYFFICLVLGVLEFSLSFDNSIINARILRDMSQKWRGRFLSWGIIIAVFGMRIVFPLAIVAIAARLDPISAINLAIFSPDSYARVMAEAHTGIAAFGGTFLLMVAIKFFFDSEKDLHWIRMIEARARKFASLHGIEVGLALIIILIFSSLLEGEKSQTFLIAALYGLLSFLAVEGLGAYLDAERENIHQLQKTGAGAFIYLEVLDASFSFDGVIGAFALSTNLFIIAIGLGIGAFYIRSMTIMLVEKKTLGQYLYLEHGAFYAILILALIMFAQTLIHIPEVITGLIGICFIGGAFISSVRHNRNNSNRVETEET